ncbi:MAG: BapA prefix-like domain-containing protein [Xanthomonadaceae bacterium]|nr:BapA prefix-like domain-containing protein [Xanthomonadaceae bacterium]
MSSLNTVTVTDKATGQSAARELSALRNPVASVITLQIDPEEVAAFEQQAGDLVITLKSGESIVIEGFFVSGEEQRNELILQDSQGLLWWGQYEIPWNEFWFTEISTIEAAGVEKGSSAWWLVAGVLGAGAIAVAAGGGGGGGGSAPEPEKARPTLVIPEAADGYIDADELADGGVEVRVGLVPGAREGDTVVVEVRGGNGDIQVQEHVLTWDDVAAGAVELQLPEDLFVDGASYEVVARVRDA